MINEYLKQKETYFEFLVLIKSGNFYCTYGNDSYILNYLFNYKIIKNRVAFPEIVLEKVKSTLEKEMISYIIIEKGLLYYSSKYKNYEKNYEGLLKKSKKTYSYKKRINFIQDKLLKCLKAQEIDDKLSKIEDIL
jgi:hypothetical protein